MPATIRKPHLVQLLLPLADPAGHPFAAGAYDEIARELTERFGGLTAYARAPASGLWQGGSGQTTQDDVVVFEVMVERLDTGWWTAYRKRLEARFAQEELVVRAQAILRL